MTFSLHERRVAISCYGLFVTKTDFAGTVNRGDFNQKFSIIASEAVLFVFLLNDLHRNYCMTLTNCGLLRCAQVSPQPSLHNTMRVLRCLLLALVAAASVSSATDSAAASAPDRARLLASKRVHNLYLVEGADIVVQYSLYNIGTAPALNVQLTDASFK